MYQLEVSFMTAGLFVYRTWKELCTFLYMLLVWLHFYFSGFFFFFFTCTHCLHLQKSNTSILRGLCTISTLICHRLCLLNFPQKTHTLSVSCVLFRSFIFQIWSFVTSAIHSSHVSVCMSDLELCAST